MTPRRQITWCLFTTAFGGCLASAFMFALNEQKAFGVIAVVFAVSAACFALVLARTRQVEQRA